MKEFLGITFAIMSIFFLFFAIIFGLMLLEGMSKVPELLESMTYMFEQKGNYYQHLPGDRQ